MTLTPAEIHNREFGKASIGRRGYDKDEVDTLLDEVTQEMVNLLEENDVLQRRLGAGTSFGSQAASGSAPETEISAVTAELDRARLACYRAEQNAHLVRRRLDQARQPVVATTAAVHADTHPDPVMTMARRTADDHLRRADEESRTVLTHAHEQAERVVCEARELASEIDRKTRRHEREAVAELAAERANLLRDIGDLAEFARNYRAALEDHVTRQGHLLDGTARSVADSPDQGQLVAQDQ